MSPQNLMNSAHKTTNPAYRKNYDQIRWSKPYKCPNCGAVGSLINYGRACGECESPTEHIGYRR